MADTKELIYNKYKSSNGTCSKTDELGELWRRCDHA
jgi:hypothetical protein